MLLSFKADHVLQNSVIRVNVVGHTGEGLVTVCSKAAVGSAWDDRQSHVYAMYVPRRHTGPAWLHSSIPVHIHIYIYIYIYIYSENAWYSTQIALHSITLITLDYTAFHITPGKNSLHCTHTHTHAFNLLACLYLRIQPETP